jgi:hypothetical protein
MLPLVVFVSSIGRKMRAMVVTHRPRRKMPLFNITEGNVPEYRLTSR